MAKTRLAVIGVGQFGRNHCRAIHESERADLTAVVDSDPARAAEVAALYNSKAVSAIDDLTGKVDAAIVAVPTTAHAGVGASLLRNGIDVLVEKPIAPD